jgi:catechol 2,3-dioxygenase-like lactoylglutathione lyase family enzyme
MALLTGLNHVAVITADLDRFVAFYTRVFEMEEVFRESGNGLRHAILKIADGSSWLHPAEIPGNGHAVAIPQMFRRGHLDHIALTAESSECFEELRKRLLEAGASDGRVEDLGAFHSLWFQDPDGMRGELTLLVNPTLDGIHAPQPLTREAAALTPPQQV